MTNGLSLSKERYVANKYKPITAAISSTADQLSLRTDSKWCSFSPEHVSVKLATAVYVL